MASIDLERLRELQKTPTANVPYKGQRLVGFVLSADSADCLTGYLAMLSDLLTTGIEQAQEIERLRKALKELLQHAGIADAAPEDIDAEDHAREREARAALASTPDGE